MSFQAHLSFWSGYQSIWMKTNTDPMLNIRYPSLTQLLACNLIKLRSETCCSKFNARQMRDMKYQGTHLLCASQSKNIIINFCAIFNWKATVLNYITCRDKSTHENVSKSPRIIATVNCSVSFMISCRRATHHQLCVQQISVYISIYRN